MFKVPESKAKLKKNRFDFEIGGVKYDVPKLAYLSGVVVDMLAEAESRGGVAEKAAQYAIFGSAGTPIGDAVRTLDPEQLAALLAAYQEASKITAGESPASTDS